MKRPGQPADYQVRVFDHMTLCSSLLFQVLQLYFTDPAPIYKVCSTPVHVHVQGPAVFLASDDSAYVTGSVQNVTGGMIIG